MKRKTPQSVSAALTTAAPKPESSQGSASFQVQLHTMSTQILLEAIDHPVLKAAAAGKDELNSLALSGSDALSLVFIFVNLTEAWRTFGYSKDNFFAAAQEYAFKLPPSAVAELVPAIKSAILSTLPASGEEAS